MDTHTHLESFARRGELATALLRAREAGVERMIAIGTEADDWSLYRQIATENADMVSYSVGLHPCSVDEKWAESCAQIEAFWLTASTPVALGEIGLDRFHLPKDDIASAAGIFDWQRAAFAEGLRLAKRLNAPIIVHSRGAFGECVEMIDAAGIDWARVVFHCFTEGPAEMAALRQRGGFGSFTGIITYKTAESIRAAALAQGLDRLMLETDAPYLSPVPHRGKPNQPAYIRHTAEFCAGLFGVSYETLVDRTTANAKSFFGI